MTITGRTDVAPQLCPFEDDELVELTALAPRGDEAPAKDRSAWSWPAANGGTAPLNGERSRSSLGSEPVQVEFPGDSGFASYPYESPAEHRPALLERWGIAPPRRAPSVQSRAGRATDRRANHGRARRAVHRPAGIDVMISRRNDVAPQLCPFEDDELFELTALDPRELTALARAATRSRLRTDRPGPGRPPMAEPVRSTANALARCSAASRSRSSSRVIRALRRIRTATTRRTLLDSSRRPMLQANRLFQWTSSQPPDGLNASMPNVRRR